MLLPTGPNGKNGHHVQPLAEVVCIIEVEIALEEALVLE